MKLTIITGDHYRHLYLADKIQNLGLDVSRIIQKRENIQPKLHHENKNILKLLNPFKNFTLLNLCPFMTKTNDTKPEIKKVISKLSNEEINYFKDDISSILSKAINYQNQIRFFIDDFFEKLNIKMYISHHTRGVISPLVAEIVKKKEIKSILIPHGTLPNSKNKLINELIKEISKGFIDDNFSSQVVCQSKTTEIFIKKNYPEKLYKKFQPIMW